MKTHRDVVKTFPPMASASVWAWVEDGTAHVAAYSLCPAGHAHGMSRGYWPKGVEVVKVTLAEALGGCSHCLERSASDAFISVEDWADALALVEARARAKSIRKVTASTAASAIASRRMKLKELVLAVECLTRSTSPDIARVAGEVEAELHLADDVLKALGNDPETIEKVKTKVKELMVPKRFAGLVELDETPHLIGISELPWRVPTQVQAALEAFAIKNDGSVVVLLAPAYVYAFLLQQLFSKSSSTTLVVGYPAPEDPAVCEVAAGIWDPEGASSQACMKTSIETAHALV